MRARWIFLIGLLLVTATATATAESPDDPNTVYRNAMYLYLRIAGVFWIGLEWVAAFVLWRAYRQLRTAAARVSSDA